MYGSQELPLLVDQSDYGPADARDPGTHVGGERDIIIYIIMYIVCSELIYMCIQ